MRRFLLLGLCVLGASAMAACGPQPVPETPTFEADVRPIMLARCTRCHSVGVIDDASFVPDPHYLLRTSNGAFESFGDPPNCVTASTQVACRGLHSYTVA